MLDNLKNYCKAIIPLTEIELSLLDHYFEMKELKKREFLLQEGKICDFFGFVSSGVIRHFHIKAGIERTCYISFENSWVTDFQSFTTNSAGVMNLQALEYTILFTIKRENLNKLYSDCIKFERFGRIMAEQVAQRATEMAMSFSSNKPEERFQNLIKTQPDFFQRVPQKYIANFLGISPESLSRIQRRIHGRLKS